MQQPKLTQNMQKKYIDFIINVSRVDYEINVLTFPYFIKRHKNDAYTFLTADINFIHPLPKMENPVSFIKNYISNDIQNEKLIRIYYDVAMENDRHLLHRNSEKYSPQMAIFKKFPELLEYAWNINRKEYLPLNLLEEGHKYSGYTPDGDVESVFFGYKYKNTYMTVLFNTELFTDLTNLRHSETYVHVFPYKTYPEDAIRKYCKKYAFRHLAPIIDSFNPEKGHTGGNYTRQAMDPEFSRYRGYRVSFLSPCNDSLEISVVERGNDFIMLAEELHFDEFHQRLVGRMLHCDVKNAFRKPLHGSSMGHIDLTINHYLGDNIEKRRAVNISDGPIDVEPDYRCRVFRMNNVEFEKIITIAKMSFENECLVAEWARDLLRLPTGKIAKLFWPEFDNSDYTLEEQFRINPE